MVRTEAVWCLAVISYCEVSIRYNEAIILCKSPQDAVWHASALEGLATIPVLEAWSSAHGLVRVFKQMVIPFR